MKASLKMLRTAMLVLALALAPLGAPMVFAAQPAHEAAGGHADHAGEHGGDAQHAEGHHDDAHHHAAALSDLLFPAINFAIYLVIIVRFVIPAMREFLRRRRADVVQAESEGSAALARAEQDLAAKKTRLAGLKAEAESLRQDLVAIATRQAERVVAQAEDSGKRRVADAELLAEQESRRALGEVRAELAREAANLAEQRIRTALTADDQRTFVQQFLKEAATR
jgi:F0F1-type ATP synthase membrane subunit b/b'